MTTWPPVAPTADHAPGRAPEAAGLPAESEGWVPSTWRLGGGVPPPMGATLMPPPTSTAPAGQPPVALTIVAGAAGPRTVLIATTSTRGAAVPGGRGVTNSVALRDAWRGEACPQAVQASVRTIAGARTRAVITAGSSTQRRPSSWHRGSAGRRLRRPPSRRRRPRRWDGRRRRWERSP